MPMSEPTLYRIVMYPISSSMLVEVVRCEHGNTGRHIDPSSIGTTKDGFIDFGWCPGSPTLNET